MKAAVRSGRRSPRWGRWWRRESAASVGVAIAYASWHEAWGSLLQLLLNVCLLIVVGAAGLSAQRAIWRRRRP